MDGEDEVRARANLLEMQGRISQGPHVALGVAELATPNQVHTAFLELTKQFHPARFVRMSAELQRMSNEVFLGIKSAHDSMLRNLGASLKPKKGGSGPMRPISPESSSAMPASRERPSGLFQPARGTAAPPARPSPGPQSTSRPPTPPGGTKPISPSQGVPVSAPTPSPPPVQPMSSPVPPRRPTPAMGMPIQRPSAARPPVPTTTRLPPLQRAGTPPQTPPQRPSSPADINPETVRYAGAPATGPKTMADEASALEEALRRLAAKDWAGARQALHSLAARVPQSKPYRALLCYARGREAQVAGKPDDAALEFQRALQLDPDLAYAKIALAEVQRRR